MCKTKKRRSTFRLGPLWVAVVAFLVGTLVISAMEVGASPGTTERVSVDSSGAQGNGPSYDYPGHEPSISADGRYAAFSSQATNLVPGDTNIKEDIFVHDRQTGITERVSIHSSGSEGNGDSIYPSISADGQFVAFQSDATNLVVGDTYGKTDIFVHDRTTGTTERVSVNNGGTQGNSHSYRPSISADGRFVAFESYAYNLVDNDTNASEDIFVHDRINHTTERVSVDSSGKEATDGPSSQATISADGQFVAFQSGAPNLVDGDTNYKHDIFVHDRTSHTTERVSVHTDGTQGNDHSLFPSISGDGQYVAFYSGATNLHADDEDANWDVFVRDRLANTTELVSVNSSGDKGDGLSKFPSISADGRYVTFQSTSYNLVDGDTNSSMDIFLHDRQTDTTERVSVDSSGIEGNGRSFNPSISADGFSVIFFSDATNLVSGDTNGCMDVFVHDRIGLVAYYPFNGNADDESGYENDGTVDGATLTEDRFGNENSAYYFDGENDLITTAEDDFAARNNVSVSFWFKPVEQTYIPDVYVYYFLMASGFGVFQETDDTAGLAISIPGTNNALGSIPYGDWIYFAGTYDGQDIRAYINGSLAMTKFWKGNMSDPDRNLTFGYFNDVYWEGTLDDVRIYNRVLSQAEIRGLMGPLPDPCFALGGDTDGDGICDDGDRSGTPGDNPCTGGNTANCDDNCPAPGEVNPDQADYNNNGVGDLCDDFAMGEESGDKPEGTAVPSYTPTGELFLDVTVTLKAIFTDRPTPYIRPNEYNVIARVLGSDMPADTIHCGPFCSIPDDLVWVPVNESLDFPVQLPLSKWWTKLAPGTTYPVEVWYVNVCKELTAYDVSTDPEEVVSYPDIVQVNQLLDTVDLAIDQQVGDQCPGDDYEFGQGAGGTGCPYADYNLVMMHEVYLGKGPSVKYPLSGASVHVYDRNNSSFQSTFGNNPVSSDYPVIFESTTTSEDGFVRACITGGNGECYVGEPQQGDYLVIVRYVDEQTGKTAYVGRPKGLSDFVNGVAEKEFQIIKVTKRDESVQFRGGKRTFVTGSILEVISPETAIWEGTQSVYPFIFTSDSDWSVDVCAEVPSGYSIVGVYDENGDLIPSTECVKTFVSGETKTVAFEVQEVGSPEPLLDATLDIVSPKGEKLKEKFKTYDIRMKTFKAKVEELKAKKKKR